MLDQPRVQGKGSKWFYVQEVEVAWTQGVSDQAANLLVHPVCWAGCVGA